MADKKTEIKNEKTYTKTVFVYDGKEFPGDDIELSDMIAMLSSTFPEVSNATTETAVKDGVRYIEFIKKAGTKGATSSEIVAKLDTLHALPNIDSASFKLVMTNMTPLNKQEEALSKQVQELNKRTSAKSNVYRRIIHLQPAISSAIIEGI